MKAIFLSACVHLVRIFCLLACLLTVFPENGHCIPEPMNPPRMVNDFAKMFTAEETEKIEAQLRQFYAESGAQIYVVTVNSLEGMSSLELATKIGNHWGVGQKAIDNGVVLLLKPKTQDEKGVVAIALGKGVEKFLTSQEAQSIIDYSLIPLFKKDMFAEGVQQATHSIQIILKNKFQHPDPEVKGNVEQSLGTSSDQKYSHAADAGKTSTSGAGHEGSSSSSSMGFYFFVGGFILLMIVLVLTGNADVAWKVCLALLTFLGAIFTLALIFGGSGGKGSGRGGGGFSGGGGGSFGGGGASGSW